MSVTPTAVAGMKQQEAKRKLRVLSEGIRAGIVFSSGGAQVPGTGAAVLLPPNLTSNRGVILELPGKTFGPIGKAKPFLVGPAWRVCKAKRLWGGAGRPPDQAGLWPQNEWGKFPGCQPSRRVPGI